jgi:hypothetical protein
VASWRRGTTGDDGDAGRGVVEDLRAAAQRLGVTEDRLVEEAVRRYVGLEILDQLWARTRLSPDEAEAVAAQELRAYRAERRAS